MGVVINKLPHTPSPKALQRLKTRMRAFTKHLLKKLLGLKATLSLRFIESLFFPLQKIDQHYSGVSKGQGGIRRTEKKVWGDVQ